MERFDKYEEQVGVMIEVSKERLNLQNMEDEALVDELEHLIQIVPQISFENDVLPIIIKFYNGKASLSKKERTLLEGSYILGHINLGIQEEGYMAQMGES